MSSRKILLIDYDPESIESTIGPLTDAGYQVEVANDGIAGLEAFERLRPDLVLIEPMVPRKHGFEVCQEIKDSPHGKEIPVLIATGFYRGRKHHVEAKQFYGCDEYLEKPIGEELLLATCRRFLESGQDESSSAPPDGKLEEPLPALEDLSEDEIVARLDALIAEDSESASAEAVEPAPAADEEEIPADLKDLLAQSDELERVLEPEMVFEGEAESEPSIEAESGAEPEAEAGAGTEAIPEAEAGAETETIPEPKAEPVEQAAAPQPALAPEPQPAPRPEPAAEIEPEPAQALETPTIEAEPAKRGGPPAWIWIAAVAGLAALAAGIGYVMLSGQSSEPATVAQSEMTGSAPPVRVDFPAEPIGPPAIGLIPGEAGAAEGTGFSEMAGEGGLGGSAPVQAAPETSSGTETANATPEAVATESPGGAPGDAPRRSSSRSAPAETRQTPAEKPRTDASARGAASARRRAAAGSGQDTITLVENVDGSRDELVTREIPRTRAAEPTPAAPEPPVTSAAATTEAEGTETDATALETAPAEGVPAGADPGAGPTGAQPEPLAGPGETTTQNPATLAEPPVPEPAVAEPEVIKPEVVEPPKPRVVRGQLLDISEVDVAPVLTKRVLPQYHPMARQMRLEGTVRMRLLVNEEGSVDQVEVISTKLAQTLKKPSVQAARGWKFEPATKDGVPVKVWIIESVTFKL